MKKIAIAVGVVILSFPSLLPGQNRKELESNVRDAYKLLLKETDKNKDGKIGKEEFYAIWKDQKVAEKNYKAWDTNKDGFITENEYVKAVLDMGGKKK